jgi:hypothetical protein
MCVFEECRSLAYVGIKTIAGSRSVCFQHYLLLDKAS